MIPGSSSLLRDFVPLVLQLLGNGNKDFFLIDIVLCLITCSFNTTYVTVEDHFSSLFGNVGSAGKFCAALKCLYVGLVIRQHLAYSIPPLHLV